MTTMSSLQRRLIAASTSTTSKCNDMNHKQQSFETCFSAGLDLTEFSGGGGGVAVHCASADLAQQKAKDCARRSREEKAEAELEQRVAAVVHAASNARNTDASSNDNPMALGGVIHIPRALHPHNNTKNDEILGNDRDNNFIQFQNDASISGGLLSSLVSDHKREERLGTISHKSRQLLNQRKISSARSSSVGSSGGGGISSRRQVVKSLAKPKSPVGKTTVAKKPRKYKY